MYKRILLAYDGTEAGQQALLQCEDLVQWGDASLWLVAVMPGLVKMGGLESGYFTAEVMADDTAAFETVLADGLDRLAAAGFTARGELLVGDAVPEISGYAKKMAADLIIVGHKHLDSWAARWWRGATSSALVEHAPCSVLCVISK
jgi:nucleotide-binding universal stress UspA family protein